MLTGDWLEINKLNQISIVIGKKRVPLRCTVHQVELFRELHGRQAESKPEESGAPTKLVADALDLMEIILNPTPDVIDFDRAAIEETFDVDQMKLLTHVWIERKLYAPRLESDPQLGGQAAQSKR